ncbi:RGCVC family protein [Amycolatopsis sp. MEPSY49]|uniref:RGCVC family protein n=1 Tax=Amycolatopsis sp. MEPSY49 TaxID=3151600 RepID=UPI003F516347
MTPGNATACAACRHAQHTHDPIARRFCTATVAGGFNRGCVCVGGHDELEKEKP